MHKVQILLIDADRTFLTSFGQGLREAGYQVLEAASAAQAVELCRRHHPDLAILDVRMAGMSGIDLARQLREECDLPCLFLASAVGSETVRQAVAEGALGYLVKPLEIQRLLPSVETALSWARELRRLREAQAHLYRALEMTRQTSVAIGVLMERYRLAERQAFEVLRARARTQHRKFGDVAREVVQAVDNLNRLNPAESGEGQP